MALLAFRPFEKGRRINHDLTFGVELDLRAVHRSRRGAFEVDALAVVTATVTRAFEFVFAGFPVGGAAEMSAARIDHKETIGSTRDPDAVLLLPLRIDADSVISGRTDLENTGRLENRTRQEKPNEHQKESSERAGDRRPNDAATHFIDGWIVRSGFDHFRFGRRSSRRDSSRHVYSAGWWSSG